MEGQEKFNNITVPVAIIIAGLLIAGAVYFRGSAPTPAAAPDNSEAGDVSSMPAVSAKDHIRGNPNAPVKIIEYSDLECPFCKRFHDTMNEVMKTYGQDGKVAWVYRHFPLIGLHPKAPKEAEATECVAELGGNDAFWRYLDLIFTVTPSNDKLDPAKLPELAIQVGINKDKFNQCLSSGKYSDFVNAQIAEAVKAGGEGTPYPIIINKKGERIALPGALPYDQLVPIIEQALK